MRSTTAIRFDDVTLGYGRRPAVHHLDGEIPAGSLTAIVGPNGAGKSTLLKGVVGTLQPLGGRITLSTGTVSLKSSLRATAKPFAVSACTASS